MYQFIVYDKITEEIKSEGGCSGKKDTLIQGNRLNEESMEGAVEDRDFYKVKDKKIVRRSEAEIKTIKEKRKAKKTKITPPGQQIISVTQEQLQSLSNRVRALEKV